ncbi:carbamoyltransferase family protein [Chondromyces crocatus]|uniref:Carbamoyltransferase n=1 Tax=Chondromyces crocatus TaxID=52 RepID=A0A0K1ECW0_CHOCO|nr:carbamoyltransferase [Chondromyces crocatus]AKT38413.1 carbamoyltransferase [Chondromyces crocatus]
MRILGLSAYYHDAAAALLSDGDLVTTVTEEIFTRKKHDASFPARAVAYCLEQGGITARDLDHVVFYEDTRLKFDRLLASIVSTAPRSLPQFVRAIPQWLGDKLWTERNIRRDLGYDGKLHVVEHHASHAASAFLCSPFEEAAILTVDGVGEWATATMGVGRGPSISIQREIRFPHSLGLLYSAFTHYLGFKVNSAEYKVMGLAPYGEPTFDAQFREIIDVAEDGSFRLDMKYFRYHYALDMTHPRLHALFGGPPRRDDEPLTQRHKDIAASLQRVVDTVMVRLARALHRETGLTKLCLAGGVALNCVANGHILRETPMKELFIQPAASDAGGALGAALYAQHALLGQPRSFTFRNPFLGPSYTDEEIETYLRSVGATYEKLSREDLLETTAKLIEEQHVIGWFQGKMEWGPRALGARSILGDARSASMRDTINLKIKFREGFRPFAPTVLAEHVSAWFELDCESPYMLLVAQVRPSHRTIPAVTHVDGSARVQSIERSMNPLYYDLVETFHRRTGTPIIINTSFNVRGEPIVMSPQHAHECFMRTDMDDLILGSFWLKKSAQKALPHIVRGDGAFAPD